MSASFHHTSRGDPPGEGQGGVTMRKISFRSTSRRSSHPQPGADWPTGRLAQAPSRGVSRRICAGGEGFRHPQRHRAGLISLPRGCQQILADIYLCTSNGREAILMAAKRKVDNLMALAVLATVVQQPMHRYQIASLMRARGKDQDMDVKWGSLYTVMQNLAKHGCR